MGEAENNNERIIQTGRKRWINKERKERDEEGKDGQVKEGEAERERDRTT